MQPRTTIPGENVGPGPNYYDLMYYRPGKSGPGYSFGVRHHHLLATRIEGHTHLAPGQRIDIFLFGGGIGLGRCGYQAKMDATAPINAKNPIL